MKIALVHDDLIQFGGAERVLMALSEMFPKAPVYTAVASKKWQRVFKKRGISLRTSFMQKLPFVEKLNRYYSPFLLHLLAFEGFDFTEFDLVISVSTRFAHGIITKPATKHVCYMNSPGRMIWEPNDYFEDENYGFLYPIRKLAKPFLELPLKMMRNWDKVASTRPDYFVANSKTPQERIKKYYGRNSEIIYPFTNVSDFISGDAAGENNVSGGINNGEYFVTLTRLSPWKRVDVAIKACNSLKLSLKVVGEGPDIKRLKEIAGPTIEFMGYVSHKLKRELLSNCKALIVTQKEDFGISPLEAMACGKPVIAYRAGGTLETVVEGKTGEFFDKQVPLSLENALRDFDPGKYIDLDCIAQARKFDRIIFERQIRSFLGRI